MRTRVRGRIKLTRVGGEHTGGRGVKVSDLSPIVPESEGFMAARSEGGKDINPDRMWSDGVRERSVVGVWECEGDLVSGSLNSNDRLVEREARAIIYGGNKLLNSGRRAGVKLNVVGEGSATFGSGPKAARSSEGSLGEGLDRGNFVPVDGVKLRSAGEDGIGLSLGGELSMLVEVGFRDKVDKVGNR